MRLQSSRMQGKNTSQLESRAEPNQTHSQKQRTAEGKQAIRSQSQASQPLQAEVRL